MFHPKQIIYFLFGMLFLFTACQKIDMDNKKEGSGSNILPVTKPSGNGGSGTTSGEGDRGDNRGEESDKRPDGTIEFPVAGHVDILQQTAEDETSTKWLLVSLEEWDDVCSAWHEQTPQYAHDIAAGYKEGELTGWRIPTKAEAQAIKDVYLCYCDNKTQEFSDELDILNWKLKTLGGHEMRPWEKANNFPAYRYLCGDAYYTFSLKSGSTISKAGVKATYHLRLVKDTIIKNNND